MTTQESKRKLTAILSADVKGYSRLMSQDEEATVKTLKHYRLTISGLVSEHSGRVVDSPGDNILAEFGSVVDAVKCAVKIQGTLKDKNAELPESRRMDFRIGVNLGDVIEEDDRIYGDGVNIAARLEGLADPGGICISGTAFDHAKNKLAVGYQYLGEQAVKNIPDPVRAYKVMMEPEQAGKVIGEKGPKRTQWWWAPAAVALLVLVAVGLVWNFYWRAPKIAPASKEKMAFPLPDNPSIAVLPFTNMTGDPSQEFFSDGITENIITGLSQLNALFVIARNSTFTYKGKPVKVQQVAEDLGVRYVLEGSVRRSGERLRITAQFIDALKGHHLWSERYDRDAKDLFAIEDDITKKIITALQVILTQGEQARLYARGTENLDAYLKFMEGREHNLRFNKDANLLARQRAEEAIALDPEYSSAHALLGKTYIGAVFFGWSPSPKEALGRAFESAKKALALDESNSQARTVLAFVHLLKREHDAAIEECERAVSLAPNAADSFYNLGIIVRFAGRVRDAIPMFERAIRLNPIPPASYLYQLALSYAFVGDFEKAVRLCKEALSKNPDDLVGRVTLIIAYGSLGREGDARAQVSDLLRIDPKFSLDQAAKTWPYKKEADREFVLAALRKAGLPDKPPLPLPDKPSIAVLPFVNMSDDPKQEFFSDGMTEEIITALSKSPYLFVIARQSTFTYKGKPVKVKQVSEELGVRYVLEGSVRRSGEKVRVTAQFIDAMTGYHLWAERFDRDLKDIFTLQDEITLKIMKSVHEKLELKPTRRSGRGAMNVESFLKTMEGLELLLRATQEDNVLARKLFEEAVALDPNNATAYTHLAWTYMADSLFGKSPKESKRRAIELGQRAVALDELEAYAHASLACFSAYERQFEKAIVHAERGMALDPNSSGVLFNSGIALAFSGRPEEAIPLLQKAIRLDPLAPSLFLSILSIAYRMANRFDEAVEQAKRAVERNPKDLFANLSLAAGCILTGRETEARAAAEEVLKINPAFSVEQFGSTLPYKDKSFVDRSIDAWRKAGLK